MSSIADQSLSGLCPIDSNVCALVSMTQTWRFLFGRQEGRWSTENVCRPALEALLGADQYQTLNDHLGTLEVVGSGSKVRKLEAI